MNEYEKLKWGVHIHGPDTIAAAKDFIHASSMAHSINSSIFSSIRNDKYAEYRPIMFATIFIWDKVHGDHDPESVDWSDLS